MKQMASVSTFVTIILLLLFSLCQIFLQLPPQKAALHESVASRAFYASQNNDLSHQERNSAAQKAKSHFIHALANNPYEAGLWIRLASVHKTLGSENSQDNDSLVDAVRVARILRPDIQPNLDRILIQINSENRNDITHE